MTDSIGTGSIQRYSDPLNEVFINRFIALSALSVKKCTAEGLSRPLGCLAWVGQATKHRSCLTTYILGEGRIWNVNPAFHLGLPFGRIAGYTGNPPNYQE